MTEKHLSTQFDAELSGVSTRVLEMGGMVESQVARAVYALTHFSSEIAAEVLATEERVNQTEIEIDRDLSTIIARRQPTARDLRLLIAISKTIANLERVGLPLAHPRLQGLHLVGDAQQFLHVMADLVGDDVGLREIARCAKAPCQFAEERRVEVDRAVARAVERARVVC